jgi:aldehyde:ferredoxin oxidoreductase
MDSLILCKFLRRALDDFYAEAALMLGLTTGWDVTADELRATARRIVNTRKRYNIREGWTPAEDTLPRRFLSEAIEGGVSAGACIPEERLAAMVRAYNLVRGWTPEGWVAGPDVASGP